jgi:hypothetical protein
MCKTIESSLNDLFTENKMGTCFGRKVTLLDVEHILCEYSKYYRVKQGVANKRQKLCK